jgi:putative membrane-bound dehydrogenase-like protein
MNRIVVSLAAFTLVTAAAQGDDGNRLTYLDSSDPYYTTRNFPKLVTPQWVGEEGVEAVVILAIDDMRGHERWEAYLRPLLERLKLIDGRAPVSIMTCQVEPNDPYLQRWLDEGLSLEAHTFDHPCPLLQKSDFAKAKDTYDRCVDLMAAVPRNSPVAFRTPCCDSLNTPSPRFFAEIFNVITEKGRFLSIDSSVCNVFTSNDPELPRELVQEADGSERFRKYVPFEFSSFVNTIDDYPYPYVVGRLCWEFPCVTPSDWCAQKYHKPANPKTLADWQAALDATVIKQGVFNLVFHPYEWIRNDQIVNLVDYAEKKYGRRVKFLTFREAYERLTAHLLAGQPLRGVNGGDNGVRLIDLDDDGYLDVLILNPHLRQSRIWSPQDRTWTEVDFSFDAFANVSSGVQFAVIGRRPQVAALVRNDDAAAAIRFDNRQWVEDASLLAGLEIDGKPVVTSRLGRDRGVRFRDIDGDGQTECLVANPDQSAVFRFDNELRTWRRLAYGLPAGTLLADDAGRNAGLRFVDVDRDGDDDVIFSNEHGYSLDMFRSPQEGWSQRALAGTRPADGAIPPITVEGRNFGVWFHSRHLWAQNETTDRLKHHVDRRSFNELLAEVEPPPRSPAESLASMVVRPGFTIELVAAEPLVLDPVAIAWGADGKLWVVEMADYPLGIDGRGRHGGEVRFLEDTDGDGQYDRSTVFLDGLGYPTGVMPWGNGVLVTCAPEIFYAEDSDGDGRADVRRTLYRGFSEGNQQHRTNGLRYGLDNWVYCANGDSGGEVESVATGRRVAIGGRDFRIRPDSGLIDAQTGQTQFLRERDDWDNWFGSNNANPMYQFVLADHYLRRNPHVAPPDPRVHVSDAPGAAPVFPASRTFARFNDQNTANRFTSACSAIVYRDDLFGPAFSLSTFVCEPVHNLVHREVLRSEGVVFHSRRAPDEEQSEFLASTDNWFRPVMARTGPDGALWIVDMYRQVIEHPEWIPREWQERLDLRAGHDKGRIYRVYPVGSKPRAVPRLDELDTGGLVAALDSPSGWQRDMAQQLMIGRGDIEAVPLLKSMLADRERRPLARLHALCTLDGMEAVGAETLRMALSDPHPGVLRHAVRLSEPHFDSAPELAAAATELAGTSDPHLALQLAYSLGEWHSPDAGRALGRLLLAAPKEHGPATARFITAAALSSINGDNLAGLVEVAFATGRDAPGADLVGQLLSLAVAMDDMGAMANALEAVNGPTRREAEAYAAWQFAAAAGLLDALDRSNRSLAEYERIADDRLKSSLARLHDLFTAARTRVANAEAPQGDREAALRLLGRGAERRAADLAALAALLAPQTPVELQAAAVQALAKSGDDAVPGLLMTPWSGYGPELRSRVLDALLARGPWTNALIEHMAAGEVPPGEIDAAHRQRLLDHREAAVRQASEKLLAGSANADRAKVVTRFRETARLAGDRERGAAAFKKHCSACHKLADVGYAVGPDLSALTDRSTEGLLTAIFDPNRAVEAKYLNYTAATHDGLVITGMLAAEHGNSITLVASEGKQVSLLRSELESLESTSKSLMPEGLEKDLQPQNVADLLQYLGGFKPSRKTFEGNQPVVVKPEALRGEFWLLASQCEIYGSTLVYEPQFRNLGYWQSADDHAAWTLAVEKPGRFAVSLDFACDDGAAGQSLALDVAGRRLVAKVPGTGNWDTYRQLQIGTVELPSGEHQLTVRPDGPPRGPLIDLKAVRLRPVK